MTRWRGTVAILAMSSVTLIMCAGCSHGSGGHTSVASESTASSSAPAPPAVSPLTGQKSSDNPVVAVKIEDTALGRPQAGIDKADLVYVEQVEGGLTRLLAIFNTTLPTVEPVRSIRPSDPELALQFGHIIFVASGGSRAGIAPLEKSPLRKVINDRGGPGFSRDPKRRAPENLRADLAKIAATVHGPKAKSIGLVWSARPTVEPSQTGTSVRTRVGTSAVGFDWNLRTHRYQRIIDGKVQHAADGTIIATPNVIVQFCPITSYPQDRDVLGHPAQYTHTIGHGRAVVFRDGHRIEGTWTRRSVNDGTALRTSDGKAIALTPGGAWFVLVNTSAPLAG
jgi:Protein of unknown function (DUF3048) N-terminal domain/Protein of unknown function (DUF3048) C-terminal domain